MDASSHLPPKSVMRALGAIELPGLDEVPVRLASLWRENAAALVSCAITVDCSAVSRPRSCGV